ncbi:MAG TPA: hypothetical protein DD473_13110, partial [Planctomycetaceae bacterium]|nr:hypothetical protein [Planctomycetaceae bacterium]
SHIIPAGINGHVPIDSIAKSSARMGVGAGDPHYFQHGPFPVLVEREDAGTSDSCISITRRTGDFCATNLRKREQIKLQYLCRSGTA